MKVVSPEGSIFNPKAPAPIFLSGWSAQIMAESLFQIMAEIAPDRSVARSGGDLGGVMFSGIDPVDGSFFAGGEDECCGQGAGRDQDGENALILFVLGESSNIPIEISEERWPISQKNMNCARIRGAPANGAVGWASSSNGRRLLI